MELLYSVLADLYRKNAINSTHIDQIKMYKKHDCFYVIIMFLTRIQTCLNIM